MAEYLRPAVRAALWRWREVGGSVLLALFGLWWGAESFGFVRWLGLGALPLVEFSVAERLEDAPRAGGPCRITAEQVCRITALACEAPAGADRPISQWSGRELADEAIQRGIVATISPRHAARLLKRGRSSRTASATG